ncbi:NfeD family protein [Tengunoibacter tsumagoiensis]|nr:nodulation protein NfeD [Tengunoibacter tsumagoiensis]
MLRSSLFHVLRRLVLVLVGLASVVTLLVVWALAPHAARAASPHVDVVVLNSTIDASSLRLLTHAIDSARQDGARALVLEIDTPGGDLDSMKAMTQLELASSVPIIAYVSPTGGRAASAGAFVELSAQVAAMAPTTRIGASSPVTGTGSDLDSTLKSKIENDLVASITSIQERYGRNVPLATAMVTEARAYDEQTATQNHLVDLQAPDLPALLTTIDGRSVQLNGNHTATLQTSGVETEMLSASAWDAFYSLLLDPNIVFLLFIVALLGLYVEISHPGAILPGVVGAIALLLFLLGAGTLAPNWAGLGLMVLAFVLLVLDVRLPTHGVLTVGAVVSLVIGSLIFFDSGTSYGGVQLQPWLVYVAASMIGLIGLTLVIIIVRVQRSPVRNGVEGMAGRSVVSITALEPEGRVSYGGENWSAILDLPTTSVGQGTELQIVRVEGLRLVVRPLSAMSSSTLVHNNVKF